MHVKMGVTTAERKRQQGDYQKGDGGVADGRGFSKQHIQKAPKGGKEKEKD